MVETIRLESGHTLTGIVGSNPTLSAILLFAGDFADSIRVLGPAQRQFTGIVGLFDSIASLNRRASE